MKVRWRSEWVQFAIIGAMFVAAAATWSSVPPWVPVHWNAAGEIDQYGPKVIGLLAVPAAALIAELVLLLIPWIDPGRENYEQFYGAYAVLRFAIVLFLAVVYTLMQLIFHGKHVNMAQTVNLLIGALFIVLGNLLGKVRPNWFVGIRTPWTLSSKLSWDKTHRLGGWLFIAAGVLILLSALMPFPINVGVPGAAGVGLGLALVVYSYFIWRRDPDKIPPAGTLPA